MTGDKKAFTLIELMVTITVFAIVITPAISLFGSALRHQKEIMMQAEALNSASFLTEYISRALRMAQKDMSGDCIGENNNFVNPSEVSSIRFLNYNNKCQEFLLESDAVRVKKSTDDSAFNLGSGSSLTSASLVVESLKFTISGNDQLDGQQPKITFTLKLRSKYLNSSLEVQTTVSQRELDVPR